MKVFVSSLNFSIKEKKYQYFLFLVVAPSEVVILLIFKRYRAKGGQEGFELLHHSC
jgi:hypothetical protein